MNKRLRRNSLVQSGRMGEGKTLNGAVKSRGSVPSMTVGVVKGRGLLHPNESQLYAK